LTIIGHNFLKQWELKKRKENYRDQEEDPTQEGEDDCGC
jgi:hypothetical protein